MKILLGFEIETGNEVFLEDGHTVVTGITQLSGKTTCLEALSERGGVTAVTFLTKRGESGFRHQREIQPYFKEQKRGKLIDWQYVEAILEATMGEKMKIERSFIIDCCNGSGRKKIPPAKSLEEVYNNFKAAQKDATRGLDQSIYTNLAAYFEIILPQIRKYDFAEKLNLRKGFNVMNLIGMQDEMQQLVIESTMSYVLKKMENIIVVLPEAHKFIPQGRKTPVKNTAVRFIQEGAALGNFMWIDTQATTTVDKNLLKQCSNWVMGYQQEKNEVANVRENIGKHKISEKDIMELKLGHFIASLQQKIYYVYVLPSGVQPEIGKNVALGKIRVEEVRDSLVSIKYGIEPVEAKPRTEMRRATGREADEMIQYTKTDKAMRIEETKNYVIGGKVLKSMLTALSEKTIEIDDLLERQDSIKEQLTEMGDLAFARLQENDELQKEKKALMETVERQGEELGQFVAFKLLLAQMIEPRILEVTNEELEKIRKNLDKVRVRRAAVRPAADTGMPWIDIWLAKVGLPQQKILRFMAEKYPLKMTKSEIAIGVGLTAKGGYFSGAFNKLVKNGLIVKVDDKNYQLMEGPK